MNVPIFSASFGLALKFGRGRRKEIARRVRIAHRCCPIGARCAPYGTPRAGVGAVAQGQRGKPAQTPRGHWISDHRYTQQDSARERRRMEFMKGNYLIIIDEGGNP